jgi:endonuclease/exonuclease/phosphatase (EEP) superfamily protein YafD
MTFAVCACVTLTEVPRGVHSFDGGALRAGPFGCESARAPNVVAGAVALDPRVIRVVTWNLHKQEDAGWAADLARFSDAADVVLLQEAVLREDLRAVLDARGLRYAMASAFLYRDADHGVVTAGVVAPIAICAVRAVEPLLRIPKTALIGWYALGGTTDTLAIVNVHAVNFAPLAPYSAQFDELARLLAAHRGPIVFAGDFNTWTEGRRAVVRTTAAALGLREIALEPDFRARFLGQQLDHVWLRGLEVVSAAATEVTSSDHNPVAVTLRFAPR